MPQLPRKGPPSSWAKPCLKVALLPFPSVARDWHPVFAAVGGEYYLSLFLPDEKQWGEANADYQLPWRIGFAWPLPQQPNHHSEQVFERLLKTAYDSAIKADQGLS